jgi:hypothetical protein
MSRANKLKFKFHRPVLEKNQGKVKNKPIIRKRPFILIILFEISELVILKFITAVFLSSVFFFFFIEDNL